MHTCSIIDHNLDSRETYLLFFYFYTFSIEGEYVPKEDDEVTFKEILIPPRHEKRQAVHVQITHLAPGVTHERWDSPATTCSPSSSPSHGSIKDLHLPH